MTRTILLALVAALVAAPVLAQTEAAPTIVVAAGAMIGHDEAKVRAALAADGYEVRKVETEDGVLEAYALKDGQTFEVYVDTATGLVTEIKGG